MDFTREQVDAAYAALGLDPATTVSVNIADDWVRVVHTDAAVTSVPVPVPEEDEADEPVAD